MRPLSNVRFFFRLVPYKDGRVSGAESAVFISLQSLMVAIKKLAAGAAVLSTALADIDGTTLVHKDQIPALACSTLIAKSVIFTKAKDGGYCSVKNQPALGTMAHCLMSMPHKGGIDYFIYHTCAKNNLTEEQFMDAYNNATDLLVKNVTAYPGYNLTKPFYLPVQMGKKKLRGAYDSILGRWYNYNRAHIYSWVLLAYWGFLVVLAGLGRIAEFAFPSFVHSLNGKVSNTFRKYITLPALAGRRRTQHGTIFKIFDFVIPTRWESIMISIWLILCLSFNVANYHHDSPNNGYHFALHDSPAHVVCRKKQLFAMDLWLDPSPFPCHPPSVCQSRSAYDGSPHHWYDIQRKALGKYATRNKQPYVRWGYVSLIASCIMVFHSLAVMRKRNYEMFVFAHNLLGAIFVAGAWLHVKPKEFGQYMYAAAAVWCFDKFCRLCRMAWFGVKTADVQLIADETLKVKIPRPSSWKPAPLQHAFIYFFRPTCFWQSHPFTIVDSVLEKNTITFYIKVKGGMTHGLYQYLSTQPDQRANIKCSVEGPYGHRQPLQHYSSVSYITGGNGIPGLYASALDLSSKNAGQNVKLYWVIRHWKSVEWFYEELKRLQGTNVQPIVYVTQFDTPLDKCFIEKFEDNTSTDEKKSEDSNGNHINNLIEKLSFVDFRPGRPNVEELILQDINESSGAIAFVACGHSTYVDETRKVVANNLPDGKRVDFFDQIQIW
ncbi:FAD-binding domain family protein [Clavispora lusitaniae]|uniref:FAD-binding domain family protein n=1 Tax=Clavispora lusitaniae TaxID=36911 RepID=UPI00202C2075|nr:FAD-binding domain family protein [Clavispora lusitaniae]